MALNDSRLGSATTAVSDNVETTRKVEAPVIPQARLRPMSGWKLWFTLACLCMGLLMSALETSIIATALVSISSSLGDYSLSNWVVTAYLITYTGFLIIFARLSDLIGRKPTLISSMVIFTVFSLACGLSQNMQQLIIFRAFQGIGGAGLYSLAMTVMTEITPLKHIGVTSGLMGAVFASSSILGPLLGGVISSKTTWRWVFFLNIPPGVIAIVVNLIYFPRNSAPLPITWQTFKRIDYIGMITSLAGCIMLIFALESGGVSYAWNSIPIVVSLVVGSISLILFAVWQGIISNPARTMAQTVLPLFPAHLATHRIIGFSLLAAFWTGFPFMAMLISLPQRFQLQNERTPVEAGIDMLPLLLLSATGSALGGIIASKRNISWYILFGSSLLQILGLGLMSSLPATGGPVPSAQLGYQVILGLGFGLALSSVVIVVRMETEGKDLGIAMGATTQVRVLGGVISVAIGQALLSSRLLNELGPMIGSDKISALLRSTEAINTFTDEEKILTRECYGRAYNLQYQIMIGFSALSAISCLGAWKRHWEEASSVENRYLEGYNENQGQAVDLPVLRTESKAPILAPIRFSFDEFFDAPQPQPQISNYQ